MDSGETLPETSVVGLRRGHCQWMNIVQLLNALPEELAAAQRFCSLV
jgi:hypothetical protein